MVQKNKNYSSKLTLHFKTKTAKENFVAWYLDGGGEQQSNIYTDTFDDDNMFLSSDPYACPHCEWYDESHQTYFWENKHINDFEFKCQNCCTKFTLENPYKEKL